MSQRKTKLTVWEPKLQPPHPSTVSDLSEVAQILIYTLEKNWEQNFTRRRHSSSVNIGVAARTPNVLPLPSQILNQGIYSPKYGALPCPTQPRACLPDVMRSYVSTTSQVPRQQANLLLDPMPRMQTPTKARSGTLPEPRTWQPQGFGTQLAGLILSPSDLFSQDSNFLINEGPKSRPESPVLDFSSDEEGQNLFRAITQQSKISQQLQSKSANRREPNILEIIDLSQYDDDLEISAEESKGSEPVELENYLRHSPTVSEISNAPEIPDEPTKIVTGTENLLKSTTETISPKFADAQSTHENSLPELVKTSSDLRQRSQMESSQKSQDLVPKAINAKPKQTKSFAVNKSIISQVLMSDLQTKEEKSNAKYYSIFQCKRHAEQEKSTMTMSNSIKSVMMPKAKKPKFQAPFKSQETAPQDQPVYMESVTPSDQGMKITTLQRSMIQEVTLKLQAKPPMEICICLLYRHGQNQLSSLAEAKNVGVATGLMLAVLEENEPVMFYKLPLDFKQQNSNHHNFKFEREFLLDIFVLQCRKVCFNTQELFTFLIYTMEFNYHEVALKWMAMDPLVGCWLLDPDSPPKDFSQALKMLGINQNKDNANKKSDLRACDDLVLLSKAAEKMYHQLIDRRLWRLFLDLECAIVSILAVMEVRGIGVDTNRLKDMGNTLEKRLKRLQTEANKLVGSAVLLTSPQQLRKILFDKLKLDAKLNVPLTEQGGGKSTSESVLKLLVPLHPLPGIILEFRHLQKLKSTYVDGILPFIRKGQLRTVWDQTAAATGRLVSRDPNIQAFPKQSVTVQDNEETPRELWLRSAFISKKDHSFLSADFQQIELRLFAHFAQDQCLNKMFTQTEDVFEALARQWLGHSTENQITNEEREQTKRVVYAVMYGAGMNKLEQVLQVNTNEARKILNTFTGKFLQIKNFSQRLVRRAREQGFVTSLSGRRRLFPNISSSDAKLRLQSERQAVNFLIQGSAADVCKAAMIRTQQAINREALQAELMLQIHDELVWEVPDSQLQKFKELVQEAMEGTRAHFKITLPLPVALASGKTWADVS